MTGPTLKPPQPQNLSVSLQRNIAALHERRQQEAAAATAQEKLAESITAFTGSMVFVYAHLAIYTLWIAANLGLIPGVPIFDKSFVILAMEASVEAIFLSTFVLISQNRASVTADRRADLDLHINLLTEHELTKLADLVAAIAEKLDVRLATSPEIAEIRRDVAPEAVLDALDATTANAPVGHPAVG